MNLEGKTAIVTGGGTGLGAEIAKRLVSDGAKVVIAGRRKEKLEEVAETVPSGKIRICPGDITAQEDRIEIVETALSWGGVDILVNNAGRADNSAPLVDFSDEAWESAIAINLTAPFALMKLVIPHMLKAAGGSIINVSSLAALGAIPGSVGYCTTKRGLLAMTEVVAVDYGAQGVRCNAICPGSFMTDMTKHGLHDLSATGDAQEAARKFAAAVPQKRIAEPREIAGIVSFLASDDASYVNGASIPIDGGASVVDTQAFSLSAVSN